MFKPKFKKLGFLMLFGLSMNSLFKIISPGNLDYVFSEKPK